MIWVFYLQELKISLNRSAGCPPLPADFFHQRSWIAGRRSQEKFSKQNGHGSQVAGLLLNMLTIIY